MPDLNVLALADKKDVAAAINAHEQGTGSPPQLWAAGASEELQHPGRQGMIVDLQKLKPDVRYLVFYLRI